ncbi:MAG TPA: SseB family protein [Nocardioidaceae bacterium]|nr:SseB family protein [Nocardioidaceae bacterium]
MRNIPDPGFAGDAGAADPALATAMAAYDREPDRLHRQTLAVLQHTRLLVPVVAVVGEVEHDEAGLAHDKTSDMATVLMRGQDGRLALLAFTGTGSLHAWDPAARPVPVPVAQAAQAALQDGADAMVLDVAGPVLFAVEGDDLRSLAEGYTLVEMAGHHAWAKPSS